VAVGDWYRWGWAKVPRSSWPATKKEIRDHQASRKGERCKLLAVGGRDSALIRFEDGYTVITDRKGLRKLVDDG